MLAQLLPELKERPEMPDQPASHVDTMTKLLAHTSCLPIWIHGWKVVVWKISFGQSNG